MLFCSGEFNNTLFVSEHNHAFLLSSPHSFCLPFSHNEVIVSAPRPLPEDGVFRWRGAEEDSTKEPGEKKL